jgi:hypothetical protein
MTLNLSLSLSYRSRPEVLVSSPRMLNLNPHNFMPRKSRGCKTSNAFMIYRTIYTKTLSQKGLPSKMTEVSRWASESWSSESEELKNEYRDFAKKVSEIYQEKARTLVPRILPTILPTQPIESSPNNAFNNRTYDITPKLQNATFIQQQPSIYADYHSQFQYLPNFYSSFEPYYHPSTSELTQCGNTEPNMTPWIPATTLSYNPFIWQDGEISMNMDDFSKLV